MILSNKKLANIEYRIVSLLLAQLDCNRTRKDENYGFSPNGSYTSEAFGMLRTLNIMNIKTRHSDWVCHFGADNVNDPGNLKYLWNLLKNHAWKYLEQYDNAHLAYIAWQDVNPNIRITDWK